MSEQDLEDDKALIKVYFNELHEMMNAETSVPPGFSTPPMESLDAHQSQYIAGLAAALEHRRRKLSLYEASMPPQHQRITQSLPEVPCLARPKPRKSEQALQRQEHLLQQETIKNLTAKRDRLQALIASRKQELKMISNI